MVSALSPVTGQPSYPAQAQQLGLLPQQTPAQQSLFAASGQSVFPQNNGQSAVNSSASYSPLLAEANKVTLQEVIALNLAMMKNDALQGRQADPLALASMSEAIGPGFSIIA